jgi:hypothetical protein
MPVQETPDACLSRSTMDPIRSLDAWAFRPYRICGWTDTGGLAGSASW